MLNRRLFFAAAALLLGLGFVFGMWRLFSIRYATGDVYPAYSTFRADPVGAKAIYEALGAMPGREVSRNIQPLKKLRPDGPVTLVYLGVSRYSYWSERELQEFETLVFGGSRVILAFFPIQRAPFESEARRKREAERAKKSAEEEKVKPGGKDAPASKDEKKKDKSEKDDGDKGSGELLSFEDFAKRYGFTFGYLPIADESDKEGDRRATADALAPEGLETDLTWHSGVCFDSLAPAWRPLYNAGGRTVAAERVYGRGSIVLLGDSFPFSNEALRTERHPRLLARIFSGPPRVIFDEEHFGVTEQMGIVQLALKYRLHGAFAVLGLIAVLFVWQNSVPLVPVHGGAVTDDAVVGRDASQGFDNLLHRSVKPGELLATCVDEWRRAFSHDPARAQVEEILAEENARPPKQRDALSAYRRIARLLAKS